jgi:phosphoglycerate dehydrogenase-like enzyme
MPTTPVSHLRGLIVSGLPLDGEHLHSIERAGGRVILDDALDSYEDARALIPDADIWFGPGLTPDLLNAAPGLAWLQTSSVGIEYVAFPQLMEGKVAITNMRDSHSPTSEHALGMMLALARCLPLMIRQQVAHTWSKPDPHHYLRLEGSALTVLGAGQIGSHIAARARAFGMSVTGVSRHGKDRAEFDLVLPAARVLEAVRDADWVVNALPFTTETREFVSAEVFAHMSAGAVFVNVGRGGTVDEDALLNALTSGRLRGAALDVVRHEPLESSSPLWDLENVLITSHSAGVIPGVEVRDLAVRALVRNLPAYLRDGVPPHPVDKAAGY